MEYKKIYNFKTKRFVSIYGKLGKNILKKYIEHIIGGAAAICDVCKQEPCVCHDGWGTDTSAAGWGSDTGDLLSNEYLQHLMELDDQNPLASQALAHWGHKSASAPADLCATNTDVWGMSDEALAHWGHKSAAAIKCPKSSRNPITLGHNQMMVKSDNKYFAAIMFGDKHWRESKSYHTPLYSFKLGEPTYVIFSHGSFSDYITKEKDYFEKFNIGTLVDEGELLRCSKGLNHLETVIMNFKKILEGKMRIYKKYPFKNKNKEFIFPDIKFWNEPEDIFSSAIVKITVDETNPLNLNIKYYKLKIAPNGSLIQATQSTHSENPTFSTPTLFSEILTAIRLENLHVAKINICIASCLPPPTAQYFINPTEFRLRFSGHHVDSLKTDVEVATEAAAKVEAAAEAGAEAVVAAEAGMELEIEKPSLYKITPIYCSPQTEITDIMREINDMSKKCFSYLGNMLNQFKTPGQICYIIQYNVYIRLGLKKVAGYCFVKNISPHAKLIHSVCISKHFRRKGLCKILINHIVNEPYISRFTLYLYVRISNGGDPSKLDVNIGAYKCYETCGFRFLKQFCEMQTDGLNCKMIRPKYGSWDEQSIKNTLSFGEYKQSLQ